MAIARIQIVGVTPSDACPHFHPWDCGRRTLCPAACSRFAAYEEYEADDPDEVNHDTADGDNE